MIKCPNCKKEFDEQEQFDLVELLINTEKDITCPHCEAEFLAKCYFEKFKIKRDWDILEVYF